MLEFLNGGRVNYENQHANKPGVYPSVRSIESQLKDFDLSVPEGYINVKALKQYLVTNKLSMSVCVCEDATALVGRREYHSASNSVLGFSLPMERNGLRNAELLKVKSADIVNLFETLPRASVAVVVMAQPMAAVPAMRICCFASDNKFTADDVKSRKDTIMAALADEGIKMLCWSADGDSRELKTMRKDLGLGSRVKGIYKCLLQLNQDSN